MCAATAGAADRALLRAPTDVGATAFRAQYEYLSPSLPPPVESRLHACQQRVRLSHVSHTQSRGRVLRGVKGAH